MSLGTHGLIEELAELMRGRSTVVLSGAGVSTESGIPDYRGPSSKTRRGRPILYREFIGDPAARSRYWARSMVGWPRMSATRPNAGHYALAALERCGAVSSVVTQNVDGLHQAAGSEMVLELHGSLAEVRCTVCGASESRHAFQVRLLHLNPTFAGSEAVMAPDGDAELPPEITRSFRVPDCPRCTGVVRPNIVFFGENVPVERVQGAFEAVDGAGLLLVVGSSLTVYSGYRFVRRAAELDIPVAIVNLGETRGDSLSSLRIEGRTGETLEQLAGLVMDGAGGA